MAWAFLDRAAAGDPFVVAGTARVLGLRPWADILGLDRDSRDVGSPAAAEVVWLEVAAPSSGGERGPQHPQLLLDLADDLDEDVL
jgi:hypothetical protein